MLVLGQPPRVTVNNQQSFSNLNLLLRPDLTWTILSLEPEIPANLEEGNSNYDSSTSILTIPRVTINNGRALTAQLLLKADGTYVLLSAEEDSSNLTGNYIGSIKSNDKQQFNSQLAATHTQVGNELTGEVDITNVFIGDVTGIVTGNVSGNLVSFTVDIGGSIINFDGIISDDLKTLSGDYEWDILNFNNTGTWEYLLQ